MNLLWNFKVKLLYPDAKAPTKAHALDSGFDLYAHNFRKAYIVNPTGFGEYMVESKDGYLPGIQLGDSLVLNPMDRVLVGCGFAGFVDTEGVDLLSRLGLSVRVDLKVVPRSGNRLKEGLEVHYGTVDEIYRGEIGVIVTNLSRQARTIHKGDRIAQVLPSLTLMPQIQVVEELPETDRGASGYGDSGKR